MGRIIEADGRRIEFPDDATDDEIQAEFDALLPKAPGASIGAETTPAYLPRSNLAGVGFESEVGVNNKPAAPPPDQRELLSRKAQDLAWRIEGWGPREIRQAFWDEHGRPRADRAAHYVKNMEQQIKAASDREDLTVASGGPSTSDKRRMLGSAIGPFKRVGEMISGRLGLTDERAVEFSREVDDYRRDKAAKSGFWGQVENIMLDVAPSLPVQVLQVMAGGAVAGAPGVVGAAAVTGAANDPENPERGALIGGGSALVGGLAGRFLAPAGSTAARVVGTEVAGNVIPGMAGRAATGGDALDPAAMLFEAATGAGGGVSRYRGQQAQIRGQQARQAAIVDQGQAALRGFRPQDPEALRFAQESEASPVAAPVAPETPTEMGVSGAKTERVGLGSTAEAAPGSALPQPDAAGPVPDGMPPAARLPGRGMANPERGTLGMPSSEAIANSAVGQGVRGSTSIVSRLLKHFFQPLKEGLGDLPGGAALKQLSERALDESVPFIRVMEPKAVEGMHLANNTPEAKIYINAKGAPGAPSPLLDALEGRAEGGPMIKAIQGYLRGSAKMFYDAGFLRDDGTPVNPDSTAAPRLGHADGLDLLRSGRWADSTLVPDSAADPRNIRAGWTKESLTTHWKEVETRLNSDGPEAADVAVALESKREVPFVPGWVGLNGETVQFLENNPRRYIERLYNGQVARYGFGSAWGQGPDSNVDAALDSLGRADRARLRDYVRAANGAPLEDPMFRVGDKAYPLVRALSAVKGTASALALSANAIKNAVPEMLGGLTATTGRYADNLRAYRNMLVNYSGVVKNLEAMGLKSRVPWDKTIDPLRAKTEQVERAARAIRTLGTTWGESVQATFAGEKGRLIVERAERGLANGGVEAPELRAFTELTDASPAEIAQMRDGTMSSARFKEIGFQFARRLIQETQGSNTSGVQLSRAQHSRWAKALTAFTKFSTMYQYRAIKRVTSGGVDIVKGVASGDFGQVYGGTTQILKTLVGAALMNGSAQIIGSFLMGGYQKGMATLNEAYEDPLGFAFGAAGQAFVSGYAGSFLQATGQGGDAVSAFFPVHVTNQLLHLVGALNNEKEYAGRGFFGRLRVFLDRTTPIAAAVDRGILGAMFGGAEGRQLRSAKSAFYKFKRDNGLMKDFDRGAYSEWDGAMENLARLIQDGADPDVVEEAIAEAAVIGTDGKDSVRKSLLGKKMLTKQNIDPADVARFFEHAMPADVDALIAHDAMLERVANSIGTASERRGMGRGRRRR